MAKHLDGKIQEYINHKLREQYNIGLAAGAYAMVKNIHDLLVKDDTSAEEKVEQALRFCQPLIASHEGVGQKENKDEV